MIRIHADLVLRVLDGFTGRPVAPSSIQWLLDGRVFRPIAKSDGYYVLTDLLPGEHELTLRGGYYTNECLTVNIGQGHQELLVTMKPASHYPFGGVVTWLTLRLRQKKQDLPGGRLWIAPKNPLAELRIAQDLIHAGEKEGNLFFPESVRSMALPRDVLLLDGVRSEICRIEELEPARFSAPMKFDHKRSCRLYPVQCYAADGAGMIRAVFREPVPIELLADGQNKCVSLELTAGENKADINL